jgi:prefoldin subunit 5
MARRRRESQIFSMSFLDCMSCGFGAVILFFMIINAQVKEPTEGDPDNLMAETRLLEEEILEGRKNMVLARNTIEELEERDETAQGRIAEILALIEELRRELSTYDDETIAKIERVEELESDIKSLEAEVERLLALAEEQEAQGERIREFDDEGQGSRQYLTGLKVDGERTLILVDRSASMLDDTIVNIIRRRNMSDADKLRSVKWRQVVASVDWLTAQIRPGTEFQMYMFNNTVEPVIEGSDGTWLSADDGTQLDEALRVLRGTVPGGGTNMLDAFAVAGRLSPPPDNIILFADGLPTMDAPTTTRTTITAAQRTTLFNQAARELPRTVPVNILLYPLEGDYEAPILYWALAFSSGGSLVSVSRDWP